MVKPKQETVAEHIQRVRREGYRRPLRSFRELADDIGISLSSLSGILSTSPDAPKSKYRTGGRSTGQNTWFDPREFMAWWNARQKTD